MPTGPDRAHDQPDDQPDERPDGRPDDGPEERGHERAAEPEDRRARRVVIDPEGPVLIEGPVEVVLPDGRTARSDRFMAAVCTCRRSHCYPWCDTSHRRRERRGGGPGRPTDRPGGPES